MVYYDEMLYIKLMGFYIAKKRTKQNDFFLRKKIRKKIINEYNVFLSNFC